MPGTVDLQRQIQNLKQSRRALLLAHNYQPPEIQDIADLTGDSLELSRQAVATDAEIIVFCGVHFMAETAAILNPNRTVILPRTDVGCPMADMITPQDLVKVRVQHPGVPIVTYVNSSAAVKAESTICCTSANAVKVVESLEQADTVYMVPDQNLAKYTARHTQKRVHYWKGYCPIHHQLQPDDIHGAKEKHPDAMFIAHPECRPEVLELADLVSSTSGMLRYVKASSHREFIIGTERGILHTLAKENPGKSFYSPSPHLLCQDMKRIRLPDLISALQEKHHQVSIPEDIRQRALLAVERMLAVPRD